MLRAIDTLDSHPEVLPLAVRRFNSQSKSSIQNYPIQCMLLDLYDAIARKNLDCVRPYIYNIESICKYWTDLGYSTQAIESTFIFARDRGLLKILKYDTYLRIKPTFRSYARKLDVLKFT